MDRGLVNACHDCSEGGFAVAAAEMAFAGGLGMSLDLRSMPRAPDVTRNDTLLFSETASRFVVTVPTACGEAFRETMPADACGEIGVVCKGPEFTVTALGGDVVIASRIDKLKAAWQNPLNW
jgi:phosphoribosylformylglycinamidine synthase